MTINEQFCIKDRDSLSAAIAALSSMELDGKFYMVTVQEIKDTRTSKQNRALHKFYRILAEVLNAAGLDMRKLLKKDIEIPWDERLVKKYLWKPIQDAIIGHDLTRNLETHEINMVLNVLLRHLSEKYGIYVEFPSAR